MIYCTCCILIFFYFGFLTQTHTHTDTFFYEKKGFIMKFKRIVLVVLVVVFAVGNVIAEKNKVSSKFYWMRIENKKRNIKITNKGDWIIRKDFENYPIFTIANISDKDKVSIDFKVE